MSEERREPTEEELRIDFENRRNASLDILQKMANAADNGKINEYFNSYFSLMKTWTSDDMVEKGMVIPPWHVPGQDIQLVVIHTQLALLTKACNDAGIFMAAEMARRAKNSSGLVDAGGRKIIGGG